MTIKTVTPLSAYKKNWCALTAIKKPYIIIIIGTVIKQGRGNCIDINSDLLYLKCIIYHASNFLCLCVGKIASKAYLNFPTFFSEELSDLLILTA